MHNINLNQIKEEIYDKCSLHISHLEYEPESKEYNACRFELNGKHILCRDAKITPKKTGQFVTFWKRNQTRTIEPFNELDPIDFYIINVRNKQRLGQFVFPKKELINRKIIATQTKDGKRGFRVYPIWDITKNKQAQQTQKWQLNFFYEMNEKPDFKKVIKLYNENNN